MENQKVLKIITIFLFIVLFVSLAIYIPYEYFYNSKIYTLNLDLGESYSLNLLDEGLTYETSDSDIALVDEKGIINIVNFGKAKVTVKDKDNKMKYRYDITVLDNGVASLELTPQQLELKTGDTYQLIHRYISKTKPESVVWDSSNKDVVTVDENGIVKGVKEGTSIVKVTIDNVEKECVVHVSKVNNKTEPNYVVKNTQTTKPSTTTTKPNTNTNTQKPSTNTNTNTTKPSTNTNTNTQTTKPNTNTNTNTKPTEPKKEDKTPQAVITTNKEEEKPKEVVVESISSDVTSKSIYVGESYQIVTVIKPSNAKTTLTYISANTKVASVTNNGLVKGLSKGTSKITVTSANGKTYSVDITVNEVVKTPEKKTFTATLVSNGSSISNSTLSCTTTGTNCKVTLPSFTRDGYNIIGYSTNQNATTAEYKIGDSVSLYANATYYAITGKTVTVTFAPSSYVSYTSANCTMYNLSTSCSVKTPNISRANYASLGFNTNSGATSGSVGANSSLNISGNVTYNAITRINQDGVVSGCTGWAAGNLNYYSGLGSGYEGTLSSGTAFTIEAEEGSYFKVSIPGKSGYKYVKHSNVMINLPDYIPSIKYNITNASASIYRSSGYDIPGITGTKLYAAGKVYNARLKRNEFMAPMIYSTAKMVLAAQNKFKASGLSLKIYDSYRPASVSDKVSKALNNLYSSNNTVRVNIDQSTGLSGTKYSWGPAYFIASKGSRHNYGVALDTTLVDGNGNELTMPTAMHELSTKAIKYYSGSVSKEPKNYSKEMNDNAKTLDRIMTSVGFNTISGEWWHFQESNAVNRLNTYDFQVTGVYSY